jgi:Yip1 domain
MEQPPPLPRPPAEPVQPAGTTLAARLLNVFAMPGVVFEEVKNAPRSVLNWVIPALFLAGVGVLSAVVLFSQPGFQQQIREQQAKMLARQVQAGKMTQAEADRTKVLADKISRPVVVQVVGSLGAVVGGFLQVFCWGVVLWLLGRWFLKAPLDFEKALEVAGLGTMIAVLGGVVTLVLTVSFGQQGATTPLGLVVKDLEALRKSPVFLGAANVFAFWLIGVMSAGLAKLAGVPWVRAAFLVLAYWLAKQAFFDILGLGFLAL